MYKGCDLVDFGFVDFFNLQPHWLALIILAGSEQSEQSCKPNPPYGRLCPYHHVFGNNFCFVLFCFVSFLLGVLDNANICKVGGDLFLFS